MIYWLSLLMLIVLASAQPPQPPQPFPRVDAAWAFNGLCRRGAGTGTVGVAATGRAALGVRKTGKGALGVKRGPRLTPPRCNICSWFERRKVIKDKGHKCPEEAKEALAGLEKKMNTMQLERAVEKMLREATYILK